jgi:hypothetical protein
MHDFFSNLNSPDLLTVEWNKSDGEFLAVLAANGIKLQLMRSIFPHFSDKKDKKQSTSYQRSNIDQSGVAFVSLLTCILLQQLHKKCWR